MSENGKSKITLELGREDRLRLDALAAMTERSRSAVIRLLIRQALEDLQPRDVGELPHQEANHVASGG